MRKKVSKRIYAKRKWLDTGKQGESIAQLFIKRKGSEENQNLKIFLKEKKFY